MEILHGKSTQPTTSHPIFPQKTSSLKLRGSSINPSPYYQVINPRASYLLINTIHDPLITTLLVTTFHLYYLSPFTCPLPLKRYNVAHTRDIIFGSQGNVLSSKWNCVGYAHRIDYCTTLEAIHWLE